MSKGRIFNLPSKKSIASDSVSTPIISRSLTIAASRAFSLGSTKPLNLFFLPSMAIGSTPFMGRSLPSNASSPMMRYSSSGGASICPEAFRILNPIERS